MNVLDIDLDIFVDPRPRRPSADRLSATDYSSWSPDRVEEYLTEHCNLDTVNPLPGKIVTYHHELFETWRRLIADGRLVALFSLTHIDSHADMGLGDPSSFHIMCELLHSDLEGRVESTRTGGELREGNYVSFALACHWISDLKYVQHPETRIRNAGGLPDIGDVFFKDTNPNRGIIQLKKFLPEYKTGITRLTELTPVGLEPEVPIEFFERDNFNSA
jgi:hypothetical protein